MVCFLLRSQRELELYRPGLSQRPCVLVANKADAPGAAERLQEGVPPACHVSRIQLRSRTHVTLFQELRSACLELFSMGELSSLVPPEPGRSIVTAVSARDQKNIRRLVDRLDSALEFVAMQNIPDAIRS